MSLYNLYGLASISVGLSAVSVDSDQSTKLNVMTDIVS
jgi:hypothetical protein